MNERNPQAFTRFLRSLPAIQAHLLFGGGIVLFSYALIAGEGPEDTGQGLLFCIVGYPVVLVLLWYQQKSEGTMAVEEAIERETKPDKNRNKRIQYRRNSLLFAFVVSVSIIVAGFQGWLFDGFPAQYLGYVLLLFTGAGIGGVNIWYAGPLDPREDPPEKNVDESLI